MGSTKAWGVEDVAEHHDAFPLPISSAPFWTHAARITEQTKEFAFQLRLYFTDLAEEQARSFVYRILSYQNNNFLLLT